MISQPGPYCYNEAAKARQSQKIRSLYRKALKALNISPEFPLFSFKVHFNRGGIAVWGETHVHIYREGAPVVEAYDTRTGLLVRQWDGKNFGRNHYVHSLTDFVNLTVSLSSEPFVRF